MGAEQETIRLIDLPQNKADVDSLIAEIKRLDEAAKGISGIAIFGKTGNAAEARAQQQQMAAGMEQIAALQAKMIELENQLTAAKAKGAGAGKTKSDEDVRAYVEAAEARRQNIATIKDQIKWDQAEADSMVRKRIELKKIKAEYVNIGPEKQAMESGQAMITQMRALSDELLKQESSYGQYGRNVGNYSAALKTLEGEFKNVTAAMSAMEAKGANVQNFGARAVVQGFGANQHQNSGPTALAGGAGVNVSVLNEDAAAYQKLATQAGYLNTIIQKNEVGFSSVTQQIRSNERALQSLRSAGMEGSEGFVQLREETTEAARSMKEFQRQQKLLESELPGLKALTLAAKGLGGAYAIGAGATALFANGNEKVEKELNKMIAIMTVLQGLQEAWELVNQAGAASMAFRATATEAAAAATAAYEFVVEGATAATIALNAALVASGIGAVIVALGGMIYLLSKDTINVKELREAQQALNEEMKGFYETLVKSNEALDEEIKKTDEAAKKLIDIQEINARSISDQVAIASAKKAAAEADKARTDIVAQDLKKEIGSNDELQGQYDEKIEHIGQLKSLQVELAEKMEHAQSVGSRGIRFNGKHMSASDVDDFKKSNEDLIKVYQGQADAVKVKLDRYKEVENEQLEAEQELARLAAEREKFNHEIDERQIKALTEINNLIREQSADYLALQAASPVGESMQVKALKAEQAIREQIIDANMHQELRAEGLTGNERLLIRAKAAKEMDELEVQFIGREAQIRYAGAQEDVNNENMTQEAILKLREQFYARQEAQATTAAANRKAYEETQRDEALRALEADNIKKLPTGNKARDEDQQRKYAAAKEKIETDSNIKILQSDLDLAKKQMALAQSKENELKAQTPGTDDQRNKQAKDIADLEQQKNGLTAKSANIELQIEQKKNQLILDDNARMLAKKKEMQAAAVAIANQVAETTMAFVDAAAEREINRIDRQIRKNNELKEAETSRIQTSTMEETQKAASMERLEQETAMRNQALQRKLNQTKAKEAEADRDAAVLKIFGNTMIDASAAGWITPEAIAIEVIGAAQIAALLAKTIPKYEIGTDYHPGGLMMVHPGEMRIDPSGQISMTPDAATYTYGEAGTKIIPKSKTDQFNAMLMAGIFADEKPVQDNRMYTAFKGIEETIIRENRSLVAAIKKQKPPTINVNVEGEFLTYIKSCQ